MTFDPIKQWRERRRRQAAAAASEARDRQAAATKENAQAAFVSAGGSETEFQAAWPEIRTRLLSDEAVRRAKLR